MTEPEFALITLVDPSSGDNYCLRHVLRMYRGFDRLFRLIDIRNYRADQNSAQVTILDRLAMFAALYYDGMSYESLLERLSGTRNLVFMTSDLHYWSIFPKLIERNLATRPRLDPSMNRYDELFEMFDLLKIGHLVTCYECPELSEIRSLRPYLSTHVIDLHIDPDIFRDYQLKKKYDVIIYGSIIPSVYPFRARVCRLLRRSWRLKVLNVKKKNEFFDPQICGEGLARKINQSWLGLSTTSNFDYLVGKYFEIPACRSVVLGNMNDQGRSIFANRYVHIDDQMSDREILNVVKDALRDRSRLQEYADYMYQMMHSNYTPAENERKLFDVANGILKSCERKQTTARP